MNASRASIQKIVAQVLSRHPRQGQTHEGRRLSALVYLKSMLRSFLDVEKAHRDEEAIAELRRQIARLQ